MLPKASYPIVVNTASITSELIRTQSMLCSHGNQNTFDYDHDHDYVVTRTRIRKTITTTSKVAERLEALNGSQHFLLF